MSVFTMYAMQNEAANPVAPHLTENNTDKIRIIAQKALLKKPHQRRLLTANVRASPDLKTIIQV